MELHLPNNLQLNSSVKQNYFIVHFIIRRMFISVRIKPFANIYFLTQIATQCSDFFWFFKYYQTEIFLVSTPGEIHFTKHSQHFPITQGTSKYHHSIVFSPSSATDVLCEYKKNIRTVSHFSSAFSHHAKGLRATSFHALKCTTRSACALSFLAHTSPLIRRHHHGINPIPGINLCYYSSALYLVSQRW